MRRVIIKTLVRVELFLRYDWKEYWIHYQIFAIRVNPYLNVIRH